MIRYAVIENEVSVRRGLVEQIGRLRPQWRLAFEAETVEDSIFLLSEEVQPDIIFMDVELDDGNSFDIFSRVRVDVPVVFTTAFDEYALRAFKVNSVHYLLKPIMDSDMLEAIIKFENNSVIASDYIRLSRSLRDEMPSRIVISVGDCFRAIELDNVAWFEAEEKYIYVITLDGSRYLTDFRSLADLKPLLSGRDFFPMSRSIVGAAKCISNVSRYFKGKLNVTLRAGSCEAVATVSAERRPDFMAWFGWKK